MSPSTSALSSSAVDRPGERTDRDRSKCLTYLHTSQQWIPSQHRRFPRAIARRTSSRHRRTIGVVLSQLQFKYCDLAKVKLCIRPLPRSAVKLHPFEAMTVGLERGCSTERSRSGIEETSQIYSFDPQELRHPNVALHRIWKRRPTQVSGRRALSATHHSLTRLTRREGSARLQSSSQLPELPAQRRIHLHSDLPSVTRRGFPRLAAAPSWVSRSGQGPAGIKHI